MPDSGERQYKSSTCERQSGPALALAGIRKRVVNIKTIEKDKKANRKRLRAVCLTGRGT
jgi:hypothetical protein